MKKYLSYILLVGVVAFSVISCSKDEMVQTRQISELRFNIQVNKASDADTRSVKTDWENGDKIYVFFNVSEGATAGHLNATKYVTLTYNGSIWEGAASSGLSNVLELGTAGTMYGIFFPFGGVTIASDGSSGVTFRTAGNAASMLNGQPIYTYYMTSEGVPYTITDAGFVATLTGTFTMTIPDGYVYFFVNEDGEKYSANEKCRISAEGVVPTACTGYSGGTFSESSLPASRPLWGYAYGEDGVAFSAKVDDSWATEADHKFILFSDGYPAMTKTIHDVLDVDNHNHPSVRLDPTSANWAQAMATPTYTLMGDGKNWADWNVGANSVNEPGLAFRYGEIIPPVGSYDKPTDGASYEIYNRHPLLDVVRAWLGSNWRSPSRTEMDNLNSNSNCSGTSSGTVTGGDYSIAGYKYTHKSDSGKSLFIPKASLNGYWSATSTGGSASYYWLGGSKLMLTQNKAKDGAYAWRPIYIGE